MIKTITIGDITANMLVRSTTVDNKITFSIISSCVQCNNTECSNCTTCIWGAKNFRYGDSKIFPKIVIFQNGRRIIDIEEIASHPMTVWSRTADVICYDYTKKA